MPLEVYAGSSGWRAIGAAWLEISQSHPRQTLGCCKGIWPAASHAGEPPPESGPCPVEKVPYWGWPGLSRRSPGCCTGASKTQPRPPSGAFQQNIGATQIRKRSPPRSEVQGEAAFLIQPKLGA